MGIIGNPVAHSLSPAMHNAAFESLGMDWVYVPLPVAPESLGESVKALRSLGFRGANVTTPYKEDVIGFLDGLSPEASRIKAVNTIVLAKDGRLEGHNTDGTGFINHLREIGFAVSGMKALILGSGGTARAIGYSLASSGAQVIVCSRNSKTARALVEDLHGLVSAASVTYAPIDRLRELNGSVDTVINATPLGMGAHCNLTPWPDTIPFLRCELAYDLVYHPPVTRFMEQAKADGTKVENGLGMLVHQGAIAFEIWTGRTAPLDIMKQAVTPC